ncbi:phage portal protein [Loigolactobacillus bifermentans]|uniref:phage portal protein n=1 Tax=Loigolactobacillus bifermentans TaxID=1607 RepID=UPI00071065AD|nr:phage portal protein [Loigolactobacillus bifermentans]
MGVRSFFSRQIRHLLERRGWLDDVATSTIRWQSHLVNDANILESSDVYELLSDIANQVVLAEPVVLDANDNEVKNHAALKVLRNPNGYLTGSEFARLQCNLLLLQGDAYPIYVNGQLHLLGDVYTELDDRLTEHYRVGATEIPGAAIRHIKNVGTGYDEGVGLLELGRNTLDGVMNAEQALNEKYKKGGLLAFLLRLDSVITPSNKNQKTLIDAIKKQLDGVSTSGETKIVPLGKGYSIETLESPVEDDKILSYLNVYKPDLGKYLGINVGTYQKLMETDVEKAMMYLHNKVVRPYLKNLAEHYTRLFFDDASGLRLEWRINILDFVPYSVKTTIAYNQVRTAMLMPDDARVMLGHKPAGTKESQQLYISKDLVPLDQIGDVAAAQAKGGDKDDNQSQGSQNLSNQPLQ